MPSNVVKLVMNVPGYNAYRNSDEVQDLLGDLADRIAARANAAAETYGAVHDFPGLPGVDDFEAKVTSGGTRARAYVHAKTLRARRAEATERILLTALGGGA